MPSDKHNLITAKATGLSFSLFGIALARELSFWHTAVCKMHSSLIYQCPPLCPIHLC